MVIAPNSMDDKPEMNETLGSSVDDEPVDVNLDDPLLPDLDTEADEMQAKSGRTSVISGVLENLPFLIISIVLLIVALVVFQTLATQRASGQAGYVERSSKLLALSQQIAVDARSAIDGKGEAFVGLDRAAQEFTSIVESLDQGDSDARLPPLPENRRESLTPVLSSWSSIEAGIGTILGYRAAVMRTREQVQVINQLAPLLLTRADELVDGVMVESDDVNLVNETTRLRGLSQRLAKDVNV